MMKRIDCIEKIEKKCTGCMACVDACPVNCISKVENAFGFVYADVDLARCIGCGKCYGVCPVETKKEKCGNQMLFAAYSKNPNGRKRGSSGGIFELLALHLINRGYKIVGAAFEGTKLAHRIISTREELKPLLKSKYLQSNTEGVYEAVSSLLKSGERVFFCGTPCQVSALVNYIPDKYRNSLITSDIVCHGVPSQRLFDIYIEHLERKHSGRIEEFSFRVKDNRYKHAHGYSYKLRKDNKTYTRSGIYTQSSYYNAFKKYLTFRDSCYDCHYSTLERVSDITLADFWGIEKYNFKANTDEGVSMIITNSNVGQELLSEISDELVIEKFPLQYGVDSNYCLTHSTKMPLNREKVLSDIIEYGYDYASKKHFRSGFSHRLYWLLPCRARRIIRKIRG